MVVMKELPPDILDKILLATSFQTTSGRVVPRALFSVSHDVLKSACRTAFTSLTLPDDGRLLDKATAHYLVPISGNAISAFLENPPRYADYVKILRITDPLSYEPVGEGSFEASNLGLFGTFEDEETGTSCDDDEFDDENALVTRRVDYRRPRPIPAHVLLELLEACTDLEELAWSSSSPPPDGLCEGLASTNPRLHTFSHNPVALSTPASRSSGLKWDALSLPLLSSLATTLTSLVLTRLSQAGAKSFSMLLTSLADEDISALVALESLDLHFVWLDDLLCDKVVNALGKKLKTLKIGTHGTKLTDVGVTKLLEGLEAMREFELSDVQGRLSKALWTKIPLEPASSALKTLKISISECGPHHSWSLDHLRSLASFPLEGVQHFTITRASASNDEAVPDDALMLKPVPRDVFRWLCDKGQELETVTCDWWSWAPDDVKVLLEKCSRLRVINICFDAPFVKLLSLVGSIASASNLQQILVSIPTEHTPSPLPSPSLPTPSNPLSPSSSPYIATGSSRSSLTPLRGHVGLPSSPMITKRDGFGKAPAHIVPVSPTRVANHSHRRSSTTSKVSSTGISESVPEEPTTPTSPCDSFSQTLLFSEAAGIQNVPMLDPALPPLRDLKKLFKRSSALESLTWIGHGSWAREPLLKNYTSKTVSLANVKLDFFPSLGMSDAEWECRRLQEEAEKWHWVPGTVTREGHSWDTEAARALEKQREELYTTAIKLKETNGISGPEPSPVRRRSSPAVDSATTATNTIINTPTKPSNTRRRTSLSSFETVEARDRTTSQSGPRSPSKSKQRKDNRTNHQKTSPDAHSDSANPLVLSYPRQRTIFTTEGHSANNRGTGRHHRTVSDADNKSLAIGSPTGRERAKSGAARHGSGTGHDSTHRYLSSNARSNGVDHAAPDAPRRARPQKVRDDD
ncbi:peroxin [Tulasnella sp. 331]|nr:peroxin [Tulasnella sp. 331]